MPVLGGCCCYDLKVGTKIIAILHLICSIFQFISAGLASIILILTGELVHETIKQQQAKNELLSATPPRDTRYRDTNNNYPRQKEYQERYDEDYYDEISEDYYRKQMNNMWQLMGDHLELIQAILLALVIFFIIDIIISSCLVHGVRRSRRGLFLPWLAIHWLVLVINFLGVVGIIGGGVYLELPIVVYVTLAISALIGWGIRVYIILVVTSQYQAMGLILLRDDEISMK